MRQCRTLDADVTIGYYYGDYSSCDNTIPTSLFIWKKYFFHSIKLANSESCISCEPTKHPELYFLCFN